MAMMMMTPRMYASDQMAAQQVYFPQQMPQYVLVDPSWLQQQQRFYFAAPAATVMQPTMFPPAAAAVSVPSVFANVMPQPAMPQPQPYFAQSAPVLPHRSPVSIPALLNRLPTTPEPANAPVATTPSTPPKGERKCGRRRIEISKQEEFLMKSIKDINDYARHAAMTPEEVRAMKQLRRRLKNRMYARESRARAKETQAPASDDDDDDDDDEDMALAGDDDEEQEEDGMTPVASPIKSSPVMALPDVAEPAAPAVAVTPAAATEEEHDADVESVASEHSAAEVGGIAALMAMSNSL